MVQHTWSTLLSNRYLCCQQGKMRIKNLRQRLSNVALCKCYLLS